MGVHTTVLLFCVKDNPEIVTVNIACSGVLPIVEILPLTKAIGKTTYVDFYIILNRFFSPTNVTSWVWDN